MKIEKSTTTYLIQTTTGDYPSQVPVEVDNTIGDHIQVRVNSDVWRSYDDHIAFYTELIEGIKELKQQSI